jgi:hypothetical protein
MPSEIDRTYNHEEQDPVTPHINDKALPWFIHLEFISTLDACRSRGILASAFHPA